MGDFLSDIGDILSDGFVKKIILSWLQASRILILVDGKIHVSPIPPPTPEDPDPLPDQFTFNISRAIDTIRKFAVGFSSFAVTVATRDGPSDVAMPSTYDITGFRFSAAELAKYDQVWMFGVWPDNGTFDDSRIDDPAFNPPSDEELASLAEWMDAGGGVLATGDHELLGATMCSRVPRVSAMRRWKASDGAPAEYGERRYQTTRPANIAEWQGTSVISDDNDMDIVPQKIDWVPYDVSGLVARPHPLLCHPKLGPIDVLPDHIHEGRCYDPSHFSWETRFRHAGFTFDSYSGRNFPAVDGVQPLPLVVAWGETLPSPPLRFMDSDQPDRRFPEISAYDGQRIGIGRVVVDSTWHHWFDLNLRGLIERRQLTGESETLDKILRYYVNVGIYLASPRWRLGLLLGLIKAGQFGFLGRQMIDLRKSDRDIGSAASGYLFGQLGPCWVVHGVIDELARRDASLGQFLEQRLEMAPREGSALGVQDVVDGALGALVRLAYSDTDDLRRQLAQRGRLESSELLKTFYEEVGVAMLAGARGALESHIAGLRREQKELQRITKP